MRKSHVQFTLSNITTIFGKLKKSKTENHLHLAKCFYHGIFQSIQVMSAHFCLPSSTRRLVWIQFIQAKSRANRFLPECFGAKMNKNFLLCRGREWHCSCLSAKVYLANCHENDKYETSHTLEEN